MQEKKDTYILIHYSEIALKKGNRGYFEAKLRDNIQKSLRDFSIRNVKMDFGRFILNLPQDAPINQIVNRLKEVIGIAHFSVAYQGDQEINLLTEQIYEKLEKIPFNAFKISTKRADKQYPLTSVQVNQIVGERIHTGLKKPVDLTNPDLTCNIEIFNKQLFFYFERNEGLRGLPVGSSGRVVSLLSSGIDSPVASFRMMTRGCRVIFVHFHSFPLRINLHIIMPLSWRINSRNFNIQPVFISYPW